ncbi:MAG TPA: hypothetical protein VKW04_08675 [Planctomycetota bacterium]|nr:hypothetical protein [Planctomycetota bacterium]
MSKCTTCGAAWTTIEMTLCPICGATIGSDPSTFERSKGGGASEPKRDPSGATRDSSVPGRDGATPSAAAIQSSPPRSVKADPAVTVEPSPSADPVRLPHRGAAFATEVDERVPSVADTTADLGPLPAPKPPEESPVRVDATVLRLRSPLPAEEPKRLPVSSRPLNGPLILGLVATITGILLPVTLVFESHRVLGIIGFCISGFFVPFAPIAWVSGLSVEKRRREQGLRPEARVIFGRFLGQASTLLLVAEVTAILFLIAGLRLTGNLPMSFWQQRPF